MAVHPRDRRTRTSGIRRSVVASDNQLNSVTTRRDIGAMARGPKQEKIKTDNKRQERVVERKVKDVLRPASKEDPGKSAGKTDGKKS